MLSAAVLRHGGLASSSVRAGFNDFTRVVAWISTQVSNDELRGAILIRFVTAQTSDFPVVLSSSLADQFKDVKMVDMGQNGSALQLASHQGICHHESV